MIKPWLICASAPICGTDTYYCAYSKEDPLNYADFPYDEITEDLWDSYSYLLHLDDEVYESGEERDEAWDQAYEDWKCDCDINVEEVTEENLEDVVPGGNIDNIKIIYDERERDLSKSNS